MEPDMLLAKNVTAKAIGNRMDTVTSAEVHARLPVGVAGAVVTLSVNMGIGWETVIIARGQV